MHKRNRVLLVMLKPLHPIAEDVFADFGETAAADQPDVAGSDGRLLPRELLPSRGQME